MQGTVTQPIAIAFAVGAGGGDVAERIGSFVTILGGIRRAADAGADTFVAGSAIFGQPDYRSVIDAMRSALA